MKAVNQHRAKSARRLCTDVHPRTRKSLKKRHLSGVCIDCVNARYKNRQCDSCGRLFGGAAQ